MQFTLLDNALSKLSADDASIQTALSRLYIDPCVKLSLYLDDSYSVNRGITAPHINLINKLQKLLQKAQDYLASGLYAVVLANYELSAILHNTTAHTYKKDSKDYEAEPVLQIFFYDKYQSLAKNEVTNFLQTAKIERNHMLGAAGIGNVTASMNSEQFKKKFIQLRKYLIAGDIYQVNLTYPLFFQNHGCPIKLYQRLRARQPVAYGALIKVDAGWILSLSPELFVRKHGNLLTAKPMKGTALRTQSSKECADQYTDALAALSLSKDEKNRAENVMIVDLLRNDLGRISKSGSVAVSKLFEVEAYPTILQMTSTICAEGLPSLDLYTLFQALFPCGSVTGAPKKRSLEIIYELENYPRRLYCGAIGWIDPATKDTIGRNTFDDFCFSVPIRTLLLDNKGNGQLGVGAGITYYSNPNDEYAETLIKAKFLTDL